MVVVVAVAVAVVMVGLIIKVVIGYIQISVVWFLVRHLNKLPTERKANNAHDNANEAMKLAPAADSNRGHEGNNK